MSPYEGLLTYLKSLVSDTEKGILLWHSDDDNRSILVNDQRMQITYSFDAGFQKEKFVLKQSIRWTLVSFRMPDEIAKQLELLYKSAMVQTVFTKDLKKIADERLAEDR